MQKKTMTRWTIFLLATALLLLGQQSNGQTTNDSLNEYICFIQRGDSCFALQDYNSALIFYNKAYDFVSNKISTASAKQIYKMRIAHADSLFKINNYESAKISYEIALFWNRSDNYAKSKISTCDSLMNPAAFNKAKQMAKELEQKYTDAIARGDKYFKDKNYIEAKKAYTEALTLKPSEKYPKDQIALCDDLLKKEAQDYANAIALGDKSFAVKDFKKAKEHYSQALTIKPGQKYPTDQIMQCEKFLNEQK
jgi:tetratricopeptide (TPR) repeat protein